MTADLDILLRNADPLRQPTSATPADDQVLLAARRRVDQARATALPPRAGSRQPAWRHRLTLVAAAAALLTAVPLVLSAVLPEDSRAPGVVPAAVASDGTLDCGTGYAEPIDAEEAGIRLLPDHVPAGWSLDAVFARSTTATGWCLPPSLAVLRIGLDGTVTGRLAVLGPLQATIDEKVLGGSAADTVDGRPARLFAFDVGEPFQRWIWSDDDGRQWVAEAAGLPLDEARRVLAATSTDGSEVSWDPAVAPAWTAVHRRTGAPYDTTRTGLDWYVRFRDDGQERLVEVVHGQDAVPMLSHASVGSRLIDLGGHQALISPTTDGARASVEIEVAPGTVASLQATDDLAAVEDLLASLRSVPADDPRLEQHWTE